VRITPTEAQRRLAQNVVAQLRTIDRAYDLKLLGDANNIAGWENDLAVMIAHDDLDGASCELLDSTGNVFYGYRATISGGNGRTQLHSDGGLALPILDRSRLAKARLLMHRKGGDQAAYRSQLRLQWSAVERANFEDGASFKDEHANKTTGGRGEATVHVGKSLRVPLTITRAGDKGFAFAADSSGQLSVFCHAKSAPPGFKFAVGSRITAVLIQVPKGIQARDIQPA